MIAVRREHANLMTFDPHDGYVESSTAEIEDEDRLIFVEFVEAVSHRASRRLIDDLQNIETGELARRHGRGAFRVVEVSRYSDDRIGDRLLQKFFRIIL